MYKIVSISNTMTNLVVVSPEGKNISVNLLPKGVTYTNELTGQIKNLELNKVLKILPSDTQNFSLGTAHIVENFHADHLAIPEEPRLAITTSFGNINKTAKPKAIPKAQPDMTTEAEAVKTEPVSETPTAKTKTSAKK